MNNFINYDYTNTSLSGYIMHKTNHIFNLIISIIEFISILINIYLIIKEKDCKNLNLNFFIVDFFLVIAYTPFLIISNLKINDSAEFIMDFKYILKDQIKELFLYIRFRELNIIYLHFFSLSYSLKLSIFYYICCF